MFHSFLVFKISYVIIHITQTNSYRNISYLSWKLSIHLVKGQSVVSRRRAETRTSALLAELYNTPTTHKR